MSKYTICQAIEDIAFKLYQVILEVAHVKKLPLVYKTTIRVGISLVTKYVNLDETNCYPFYCEAKEDSIIMYTKLFIEIIKYKTNFPCYIISKQCLQKLDKPSYLFIIVKNQYLSIRISIVNLEFATHIKQYIAKKIYLSNLV